MQYHAYIRPVEGAKIAALFIHGIVGTPAHFKDLLGVIPEDWSVYNILLDGHGGQVEDFARTSMVKWKAQVSRQLDDILKTHRQVFIVAHSMGTLFAIEQAIDRPDQVAGLFLLAVPMTPRVTLTAAWGSVQAALGRAKPGTPAMEILNDCGVHLSPGLWKYLTWIPRFWELLVQVRQTRRQLSQLAVPCRSFQSRKDELVSHRACKYLDGHRYITNTVLETSGHFCYSPQDTHFLQTQLREMIDTLGAIPIPRTDYDRIL